MKADNEKSKNLKRFEHYMFEMEDNTTKMIYTMIDPWIVDGLSEDEKVVAQKTLMEKLEKEYDRRWLWALGQIATDEVYDFLMQKFEMENNDWLKVEYAYYLVWIDKKAPILEYVRNVIESDNEEDVKARALSTLYFLYEHEFEIEERRNLYASILFDTMKNESKRLRLYAYDILKDYYQMKDFTPKYDHIKDLLSEGSKREDYDKATEDFEERIRSMEVVPLKPSLIVKWLNELPMNPATTEIEDCQICKGIPEKSSADMTRGETLDDYTGNLEAVVRFAYYKNKVLRCAQCGRFYSYEYEYEYLIPRSEEDEYLSRIEPTEVMKIVDSFVGFYEFKKIVTCGNFMKITY